MRSFLWGAALLLIAGGATARLYNRWQEETLDRRLAILVDWSEVHDAAVRYGMPEEDLLKSLSTAGVTTLLVGPSTVQDYLWQNMTFTSRVLAESVRQQLVSRGVAGVALKGGGKKYALTNSVKKWDELKDVELGFNPELMGMARQAGLHIVLRVNNDPWIPTDKYFGEILEISSADQELGFLFNTDDLPGGKDTLGSWVSVLKGQGSVSLLFEFHPSKSALKFAYRAPQLTYRSHTIPSAEAKDLDSYQALSRWRRAVQERSCRFLLFHMAPSDSLASLLQNINATTQDFIQRGWKMGWPRFRPYWNFPSFAERVVNPLLALLLAIVVPVAALRAGLRQSQGKSYVVIFVLTLAGASVMAALADNPLSRLEIVPFRGVKLAFALAWIGSFLMLYTWEEIGEHLSKNVRWMDTLFAVACVGVVGYFLIRTGNAGTGWKAGWEQSVRDRLELMFIARPRFKEFAIGYPLLLLGFRMKRTTDSKSFWREGRFWIGLGMIGPISMVNTFCHLHSPLYLAYFRSLNGFLVGTLLGVCLLAVNKCRS